jgi:hypothetical protein
VTPFSIPEQHPHAAGCQRGSGESNGARLPAPVVACSSKAVLAALLLLASAPDLDRGSEPSWTVPVAHAGGVLLGMRVGSSLLWPEAYDPLRFGEEGRNLRIAFTTLPDFRPQLGLLRSDGDPIAVNVAGHGVFGSELYLRARQCGHDALPALAFTWEYLVEGPYKRPSAIDLVWTPLVGGLLLGEARFRLYRATGSGFLRALLDPLGSLERAAGSGC